MWEKKLISKLFSPFCRRSPRICARSENCRFDCSPWVSFICRILQRFRFIWDFWRSVVGVFRPILPCWKMKSICIRLCKRWENPYSMRPYNQCWTMPAPWQNQIQCDSETSFQWFYVAYVRLLLLSQLKEEKCIYTEMMWLKCAEWK